MAIFGVVVFVLAIIAYVVFRPDAAPSTKSAQISTETEPSPQPAAVPKNPLQDKKLYVDKQSDVALLVAKLRTEQKNSDAALLAKIADEPQAIWLTGPTAQDPTASRDTELVTRTSTEADSTQTLPIYQLYAIPYRDACAGYSQNTLTSATKYMQWLDSILANLKTRAVFLIEADAIAHAVQGDCLSAQQIEERYNLLNQVSRKLGSHPMVLAAYLDAGHSEWFPDSSVLVEPLKKAGISKVRGIVVNTSFFAPNEDIVPWAASLVQKFGADKTAIIDTSRNGKGLPSKNTTGENRWCNPTGRGLGARPTTDTKHAAIDAFLWVKRPGESDGSCRSNPPAGTLSEKLALELARNALQ